MILNDLLTKLQPSPTINRIIDLLGTLNIYFPVQNAILTLLYIFGDKL